MKKTILFILIGIFLIGCRAESADVGIGPYTDEYGYKIIDPRIKQAVQERETTIKECTNICSNYNNDTNIVSIWNSECYNMLDMGRKEFEGFVINCKAYWGEDVERDPVMIQIEECTKACAGCYYDRHNNRAVNARTCWELYGTERDRTEECKIENERNNINPYFTVKRVIDGDTFELTNGEKVRLIGIDAPEKNERYFEEAKKRLEELILGKQVCLEKDQTDRDEYGRLLRYVYGSDYKNVDWSTSEGGLINVILAVEGYAENYPVLPDVRLQTEIENREVEAKNKKIGIWGD